MDPIMAGGGMLAGLIGTAMTNDANRDMQNSANNTNISLANENRAWQERMSNTAHQREADDLAKAGMNRILTATKGSGASTPSGGAATVQAAKMDNMIGAGLSSAKDALAYDLQAKSTEADIALKAASSSAQAAQAAESISNAKLIDVKTDSEHGHVAKINKDILKTMADTDYTHAQRKGIESELGARAAEAGVRKSQAHWDAKAMTYDNIVKRGEQAAGIVGSLLPKVRLNLPRKEIPSGDTRKDFYDLPFKDRFTPRKAR